MNLSTLSPAKGSKQSDNFRRGRGHGSGNGKTAGKGHKGQKAGLVLVLGGGLSNLYDRCIRRYVVDYANLRFGFLKKVVFNLGDLFVLAGTVLLMVLELFETGRNKKKMPGKSRRCLS